jgi:HAD superfamily hydrolase (TIGR01509 family)
MKNKISSNSLLKSAEVVRSLRRFSVPEVKKNMIEAFIFDVDGTLIDSNDFHAFAWQKALAKFGKNFSFERIRPHIGKGADTLLPSFLSEKEIEEFGEEAADLRAEIFKDEYLSRVKPFPEVRKLFEKIKAGGGRIALASSANEDEVEAYKKIANVADLIEKSTSADDAVKSKPAPDIFQAALRLLGNPAPETVLVIGDTPYDAEAAAKAKLKIVGVLCGGFAERDLREKDCIEIYQNPADLLDAYRKICLL